MEAMVALSFISGPEYERVKPRVFQLAPLSTETFNEEIPRLLAEFARMEVERRPRRTHIFQISHEGSPRGHVMRQHSKPSCLDWIGPATS
ncbi:unnamed protein product [Calypogeia fissa]